MKLMKEKLNGFLNRVKSFFYGIDHPKLSVPEFNPLSPCIIEPYVLNDDKEEENKAYIPVSLLIRVGFCRPLLILLSTWSLATISSL